MTIFFQPPAQDTVPCPKHKCPLCRQEIREERLGVGQREEKLVVVSQDCVYHIHEDIEWVGEKTVDMEEEEEVPAISWMIP